MAKKQSTQKPTPKKRKPTLVPEAAPGEARNLCTDVSLREKIALLAYSYWEARGCQGGSAEQDWIRAEQEVLLQNGFAAND